MTRTERQIEILEKWEQLGAGTLEACTGFGKTRIGLLAAEKESGKVLVIVPTLFLKNQWETLIPEYKDSDHEVIVINSAIKNEYDCDLIILDEIHMYGAETFKTIFEKVKYKKVIGLTATLDQFDEKHIIVQQYCPIFEIVSLREALDNEWVHPYRVYNIPLYFSEEMRSYYDDLSVRINKSMSKFGYNLDMALASLRNKTIREHFAALWKTKEQVVFLVARGLLNAIRERSEILYKNEDKLSAAIEIANKYDTRKIIIFSQNIESATIIASRLDSCEAYHSGISKKKREEIIKRFQEGTTRIISAAKALDMGADLPEVDMAIITSGSSKFIQAIQRYGRTLRKKSGNTPVIIVELYMFNTKDHDWLSKRQQKVPDSSIMWINSINDMQL